MFYARRSSVVKSHMQDFIFNYQFVYANDVKCYISRRNVFTHLEELKLESSDKLTVMQRNAQLIKTYK